MKKQLFSVNGANFMGALGDLIKFKPLVQEAHGEDSWPDAAINLRINWAAIPETAPNFDSFTMESGQSYEL